MDSKTKWCSNKINNKSEKSTCHPLEVLSYKIVQSKSSHQRTKRCFRNRWIRIVGKNRRTMAPHHTRNKPRLRDWQPLKLQHRTSNKLSLIRSNLCSFSSSNKSNNSKRRRLSNRPLQPRNRLSLSDLEVRWIVINPRPKWCSSSNARRAIRTEVEWSAADQRIKQMVQPVRS